MIEEFQAIARATEPLAEIGGLADGGGTAGVATSAASSDIARAATSSGGGSSIGSIATTILGSGLGLVPLVGELFGLFGGSDTTAPLEKYAMPAPISFEGVDTAGGASAADYDQFGMPRADEGDAGGGSAASSRVASGAAGQQITVNVQAMDARSFMDRSSDIAQAVRAAMLNMNSINDVMNEL